MFDSGMSSILVVVHKGVIRAIARTLTGKELAEGLPPVGGVLQLTRAAGGSWFVGRRSSVPQAREEA